MSANSTPLLCPVNPGSGVRFTQNCKSGGRWVNVPHSSWGIVHAIQPGLTDWRVEMRGINTSWTAFAKFDEFKDGAVNQYREVRW